MKVGSHTIELSNEDKVLFPDSGITKGQLIDYYARIAETMLPYLKDRPLSLQRFPDGIDGEGFYQKQASDYFPEWINRIDIDIEGGQKTQVVCNEAATLVYLANQACITPHSWLSRRDKLNQPDLMVFDIDPPTDDFEPVRDATRTLCDLLDDLELPCFLQTTGSKGIHIAVPLKRHQDFDEVRAFARDIADLLAKRHPKQLTVEQRKDKRGDRVFLDTNRNAYGQTMVTPYSVRPRPGAPVATPIERDELDDGALRSDRYTISSIFRRLGQRTDPWGGLRKHAVTLSSSRDTLADMKKADSK